MQMRAVSDADASGFRCRCARFQMQMRAVSDADARAVSDAEVALQANNDGHLRKRNPRARVLTL